MAYGIKYKADFKDFYGRNFKVELLKKDYSGSITTIVNLAPSLVDISYDGERGKLKNVQGSALNFGFYETPGDNFEDLFITAYRDYKLNFINADTSTIIWTGYIKPENLSKSFFDKNKLISLQATDAIADLKDISFEKISSTSSPILSVIKDALAYTGIELPIKTQVNTYEINYMTRGQDPLKESYIKTKKFVTTKDNKSTYDNANDVISRLLQPFNSQLKQESGKYVIFNHNEIDSSIHNYDWNTLTQQSITSSNNIVDLSTYKFYTSGDYSKIKPLRYVNLNFKNIDDGGPLVNNIEEWDNTSIWTLPSAYHFVEDGVLVISSTSDVSVSLASGINGGNPVTGKEYIKFSLDVMVEPFDPPKESGSGDFIDMDIYLKSAGGSWKKVQSFFVERSLNYITYTSTLIDDWKIKSASNDPYQFYILFNAPTVANDMIIRAKNPSITKVNAVDLSTGTSNISTIGFDRVFTGDISINYGSYEDTLYFGDCETITERSNITIGTSSNSVKWSTYNQDISNNIQIIYTQTLLNNNQKYRDYVSVEVLDPSYNINSNSIIKMNGKQYVITSYSRNYKRGDLVLTLEELVTSIAPNFKYNAKTLASINGTSVEPSSVEPSLPPTAGDHGTLTGLGDDDHPQYLNNARGDARYPSVSYIDGSLAILKSYVDTEISYIEASINNTYDAGMWFVPEASFNDSYFKWVSGYLEPSIASGGTGDVTKLYVDGSLAVRDARIAAINASLGDEDNILSYVNTSTYYDGSLNLRVLKSGDTMTGTLVVDTCIGIGKNPTYKLDVNGDINMPASSYFRLNTNPAIRQIGGYMTFGWLSSVYHYFRTSTSTPYLALIKGNAVALGIDGNSNTDLYNHRVVNLATPTDASDATNRYYVDASLNAKANKNASISYKTSAYTLSSNDNNCVIEASGTFGIYLPTNVDTGFQALIMNVGGGTITINASTGATVYTRDSSNDLTKRWTGATVYKRDSTSWAAMGDLSRKTSSVSATPTIYYKMDDTSGNIKDALGIYDSSSTDSLSYSQSGKINTAIGFDQDAGGATIPVENSIFDFSSDSSLSVSFWVKPKTNWDIDYTGRLYLGSVYSDYGLTLAHNTPGNVTFRWRDPNNKKHSLVRDISLGTYYYLTFTKLGTELKFYVDASLAFTSSESTYSSYSPATWNLGQGIMADIDEFALFLGTALTPKDVSALYNNGNGLSYPY